VKEAAENGIMAICAYAGCEVNGLNVQPDHVHLVVMIPPKLSISDLLGRLKGQTSMKLFQQFRDLKRKPYWGNHFWAKGYCVDSVGLDAEMISKLSATKKSKNNKWNSYG
jgi:putative transposase